VDLHLVPGAEPTSAESAALDSVLGPAVDGWDGGERLDGPEGNTASSGHAARALASQAQTPSDVDVCPPNEGRVH